MLNLSLGHVQALAATLGKLASWWPQPALEDRPLGDVLKVVPAEDAAFVVGLLVWGGWIRETPRPNRRRRGRVGAASRDRPDDGPKAARGRSWMVRAPDDLPAPGPTRKQLISHV